MSILFLMIAGALCVSVEELLGRWIKWVHRPRVILARPRRYKFN